MFGYKKRIERLNGRILALSLAIETEENNRKREMAEVRKKYEERIAALQGAIEKLAAEVADVRNNTARRTVSESTMQEDSPRRGDRVTMAQIMDEYLNGKEDAVDGRR